MTFLATNVWLLWSLVINGPRGTKHLLHDEYPTPFLFFDRVAIKPINVGRHHNFSIGSAFAVRRMKPNSPTIFKLAFTLSACCGSVLLFAPIIWMQMGPLSKAYYGPDVPDIYIYGGLITGKDLSFEPILIAMIVQLSLILIGTVMAAMTIFNVRNRTQVIVTVWTHTILLAVFPWWIESYKYGVICNSDGAADLTTHYEWGMQLYFALVVINIITHIFVFFTREQKQQAVAA